MAFCIYTNGGEENQWHVGSDKPKLFGVTNLRADGDELELIRLRFENIPITKWNHCFWTGEMARFIYENL